MGWIEHRIAKWKMHRFYRQYPDIAVSLPQTALLTPASLRRFMNRYGSVYVKANTQHTGKGIIKAWRVGDGYRYVFIRGEARTAATINELYGRIKALNPGMVFIVQQAVDLAKAGGRPYDIRVMMMRDRNREWQYAGMVAKVHGPASVVSNVQRGGGYVSGVEQALQRSGFDAGARKKINDRLLALSRRIMAVSEKYPFFSYQCGIDLAVDRSGKVWLIEANLHNPAHFLFKPLKDQTFYRRIKSLYSEYRRANRRVI